MAGKKLAREQLEWGSSPRGRRRARPHIRKAASRDLLKAGIIVAALVGLLMLLGRFA